ncbi:MAG: polysaccharide pyruvyl transferase family protein [Planctomycetia bacterium]|nr:polysaccharide pyruvyl transferase family protein [Planctomycetia bacterium]
MHTPADRRTFIKSIGAITATAAYRPAALFAAEPKPRKIVLRSSWQTVNIGDIAHTPGVLRLLEKYVPEAEVYLWPSKIDAGVKELLLRRFPKLKFVEGAESQAQALVECDFFLHSSGPALVGRKDVARWRRETGKPYGIYGITQGPLDEETVELLSGAEFVYFRDSVSLERAKQAGVKSPVMEFGPDGAFAVDLRDDASAQRFLADTGLEAGKFLCVIPRYRYTPYWVVHPRKMTVEDDRKHARNEAMKEHDHAPLRAAIEAVVHETEMKVLICPEDRSQVAIGKEMLFDKLPSDVKAKTVWRDRYWLTDEALSTYTLSAGLFGLEMHSPILCIGAGVPAIVGRFAEQTSKGLMWRDIGLGDWLFDMDAPADVERFVPTVLSLAKAPAAARALAAQGRANVERRQRETMAVVRETVLRAGIAIERPSAK